MPYVTFVFQKLFGYTRAKAHELMMQVHNEGRAVVSSGRGTRWSPTCGGCTPRDCGRRCSAIHDGGDS